MKYFGLLLILIQLITSCSSIDEDKVDIISNDTIVEANSTENFHEQCLYEGERTTDTLIKVAYNPFRYFISGDIMSDNWNHAIYVVQKDTVCTLHLYDQILNTYGLIDSIENISFNEVYFNLEFLDFNFDGFKDFFLQSSVSNGYTMKRGSLIEYSFEKRKLILHYEIDDLANFSLDTFKNQIIAESPDFFGNPEYFHPAEVRLEWKDGKLIEVSRTLKCD